MFKVSKPLSQVQDLRRMCWKEDILRVPKIRCTISGWPYRIKIIGFEGLYPKLWILALVDSPRQAAVSPKPHVGFRGLGSRV